MTDLSERKKLILAAVVEHYIKTGEPIGSKELISKTGMQVSSATVRNEMSDLSSQGYLVQPHTSAGRIPSDKGYRYYVDHLMKARGVDDVSRRMIEAGIASAAGDPEMLIEHARSVLAELTHCAALSTTPGGECTVIRRIELVPIGARTAMLVLLTSNGILKSRLCRLDVPLDTKVCETFYNITESAIVGKQASEISVASMQTIAASLGSDALVLFPMLASVSDLAQSTAQTQIMIEGRSNLLTSGEYGDRALELMNFLSKEEPLNRIITNSQKDVSITIGEENIYRQLENSSVILAKYNVRGQDAGSIGLIGPMRIDYETIIPSVRFLTDLVGRLIEQALEE
ncbi:MAG: heat-inducible transcription repressor HrcA [Clostridia bacterium]|nr:heat-inducible transcription repressor HrcA [Clostridia bacterium]